MARASVPAITLQISALLLAAKLKLNVSDHKQVMSKARTFFCSFKKLTEEWLDHCVGLLSGFSLTDGKLVLNLT